MSLINRTYNFTDGTTSYGSQVESEIANIVNTINSLDSASLTWTNVKVTTLLPQANVAMNSHKLTGLTPGTTAGDSVAYEQLAVFPAGIILAYGSTVAPTGFLNCDGSAVSRTTYSGLFSVVGTSFGTGDGSTTFNVPSMQNRTPVGYGGTIAASIGTTAGASTVAHTHTVSSDGTSHTHDLGADSTDTGKNYTSATKVGYADNNNSLRVIAAGGGENVNYASRTTGNGSVTHNHTGNSGSTSPSVVQPSIGVSFIIKT